jgi:hypothetical protein
MVVCGNKKRRRKRVWRQLSENQDDVKNDVGVSRHWPPNHSRKRRHERCAPKLETAQVHGVGVDFSGDKKGAEKNLWCLRD